MSAERLATGPLTQRDIEHIAQVLLRGLERQGAPDETRVDEQGRIPAHVSARAGAPPVLEFVKAERSERNRSPEG